MTYCLDTNICIYILNGKYPVLFERMISHSPDEILIPSIVMAELLHGAEKSIKRDDNVNKISAFLLPFEIVPFDAAGANHYAKIKSILERTGTVIGPNDHLIAATALARNAILVTNNIYEFSRIDDLKLENWTL